MEPTNNFNVLAKTVSGLITSLQDFQRQIALMTPIPAPAVLPPAQTILKQVVKPTTKPPPICLFCEEQHLCSQCTLDVDHKRQAIAALGRCGKCLLPEKHTLLACMSPRCCYCAGNHHKLLCRKPFPDQQSLSLPPKLKPASTNPVSNNTSQINNPPTYRIPKKALDSTPIIPNPQTITTPDSQQSLASLRRPIQRPDPNSPMPVLKRQRRDNEEYLKKKLVNEEKFQKELDELFGIN